MNRRQEEKFRERMARRDERELRKAEQRAASGAEEAEDDWEVFREMRRERQEKRNLAAKRFVEENRAEQITTLTGCEVVEKSAYTHYHILNVGGYLVNYWPSSNKWQWQKDGRVRHGPFQSFINWINNHKGAGAGVPNDNGIQHPPRASMAPEGNLAIESIANPSQTKGKENEQSTSSTADSAVQPSSGGDATPEDPQDPPW